MKLLHYKAEAKSLSHIELLMSDIFKLPLIDNKCNGYHLYALSLSELKYEIVHKNKKLWFEFKTYLEPKELLEIVEKISDNYLMYRSMYQLENSSKGFYCFPKKIFYEAIYGETK